jgi:hypothetical protein
MLESTKPGADFPRGVQVSRSATYFSRPTPLLDSRINPCEPQSTTMEHFKGRKHLELGRIDASAIREREHWRGVGPKGHSGPPNQTCQLSARTTDVKR